jgi:hypothetical protein
MKRLSLAALAALLIAGCGTSHTRATAPVNGPTGPTGATAATGPIGPTRPPFTCHPKVPAQAGECIRQQEEYEGKTPAHPQTLRGTLPLSAFGSAGIDISVWQGVPNFLQARAAGLRFVIVQTNDGAHRNSVFFAQVRAIRSVGLPWGFYTFTEAYSGASQASIAVSMASGQGATLGGWSDVEVPGSYGHACEYVNYVRAHGYRIAGKYSSPGLVEGGACAGYDWPAIWGGGRAYPLRGYSQSATVVRQNCGTCRFNGVGGEVDRDEDLGLLALIAPPAPTHAQVVARWHRELKVHQRIRSELHVLIERHKCRPGQHATPASYHTVCAYWLVRGQVQVQIILAFHRKGIW